MCLDLTEYRQYTCFAGHTGSTLRYLAVSLRKQRIQTRWGVPPIASTQTDTLGAYSR